jgi:hypothetical protein
VVRGKYAKRYAEGINVVVLDPDLADVFPNGESVNLALRALAEIIRAQRMASSTVAGGTSIRCRRSRLSASRRVSSRVLNSDRALCVKVAEPINTTVVIRSG